eukprot:4055409-Pyramimonas_sp.AAC.1
MVFRSVVGAVFRDDVRLARRLLPSSALAREHVHVEGGLVELRDTIAFARAFTLEQQASSEEREATLAQREARAKPDAASFSFINVQRRALRRRASLWAPFARAPKLQGIRLPGDGEVVGSQSDMVSELRRHWGPVFQHKPRCSNWEQLSDKYLEKFGTQFDFSE